MISTSGLWRNLFPIIKAAKHNGMTFEVSHHLDVFIVSIEPTGRKIPDSRFGRFKSKRKIDVKMLDCKECDGIVVGGICLSDKHPKKNSDPTLTK